MASISGGQIAPADDFFFKRRVMHLKNTLPEKQKPYLTSYGVYTNVFFLTLNTDVYFKMSNNSNASKDDDLKNVLFIGMPMKCTAFAS